MNNLNLSFGIMAMGANLPSECGDAKDNLLASLTILHTEPDISIRAVSRFWRSPAFPAGSGPDYVNAVALFETTLDARQILAVLHRLEARLGRDRSLGRWSARIVDLDLIALDRTILPDESTLRHWIGLPFETQMREAPDTLILPHPRMQDRGFVLAPLAEIAPDWRHPLTGHSTVQMLAALPADALAGMAPIRG